MTMDRLFRIFNELRIACYILFDYDSANSEKNIIDKSKELLALANERQDAPESLFVADGVACFPHKWEVDLKDEITDANAITGKARNALGLSADNDSGKPLIARYIARELTSRNPAFVPPSIKRIIEKAVMVTWKQSCLRTREGG
jgi:hypothetical protein